MHSNIIRSGIVIFACYVGCAQAAPASLDTPPEKNPTTAKVFDDPLSGVVINRTVTVLGNDFYQYFATAWRHKDADNKYSITVIERPSARWGSEVWVEYRSSRVFHTFLSPARQAARAVSERAAEQVHRNIMDSEVQRALYQSQDMAPEEM